MGTIPASAIVQVLPSVLSAGGSGLDLIGLLLTSSAQVPIGTVQPFATATAVSDYFGASSDEAAAATIYFNGVEQETKRPGSILFAQYPRIDVAAYLRSGDVTTYSIAQLSLLSGTLSIVINGLTYSSSSVDLAGSTSYSAAAAIIETELNGTLPTAASVTGAIAAGSASVTASIAGSTMTVTAVGSGVLVTGAILSGTGVTSGTQITAQLSGTTGGIGTYAVSKLQTTASTTVAASYGTLTVSAVGSGTLSVGHAITGVGVSSGTIITALGSGTGLTGTYIVNLTQTVASESLTAEGTPITVVFDSVSGGFVVTSGITGSASTIAYATGTIAAGIKMTLATGAVISQGSAAEAPSAFMDGIVAQTQNWATFTTIFNPDYGGVETTERLAFASWTNNQDGNYAYVCWDEDVTPTETVPATQSLGYLIEQNTYSGTILAYQPSEQHIAPFICGWAASIDFEATNGRSTLAFKSQSGLTAGVTNQQVAENLIDNGYNFYGAYATANQDFVFAYPGSISGSFLWADSYINQIWLNHALQLALMELLTNTKSIPYNTAGYALIAAACADPINAGLNFGAIRAGVTLSSAQIAEVNNAAGTNVAQTLQVQGWYLQIRDASPQVRAARGTPPMTLFYVDGQAIQRIVLSSINIQ